MNSQRMDYMLLISEPKYEQAKYNGICLLIFTNDNFLTIVRKSDCIVNGGG